MTALDRRTLLTLGMGAIVFGATGCSMPPAAPSVPAPQTFAEWTRSRRAPYFIAHRGSGDTIPEHSLPGYRKAIEWGADALELSVVRSSDGELFCHHDLTLDRTTTLTGRTSDTSAAEFTKGRIRIPRLGPRWTGSGMPPIPRLVDALAEVDRKILCVEAKDDAAFDPMMKLLEQHGLLAQVMVKVGYTSSRIAQAKSDGLPVFAYFGDTATVTAKTLDSLATVLTDTDAIVLPARGTGGYVDPQAVQLAVATAVPVWVYPVHRRSEVEHFAQLGVSGMITPSLGYVTGQLPAASRDSFNSRQLAPGLTTKDPYSDWEAVGWDIDNAIELIGNGARSVCLGDLSPVADASAGYRIDVEVSLIAGPMANTDAVYLAFGCTDDSYYPGGTGYQLSLSHRGDLQLSVASQDGRVSAVGTPTATDPLAPTTWTRLTVEVGPDQIGFSRDDTPTQTVKDKAWRGGYLHVGRTAGAARLAIRNVSVTS